MDRNIVDKPRCGEIWMCDLGDNKGNSVQCGRRPVYVISNDKNNEYSPNVNVLPITSKSNKRSLPVHVELDDFKKYGLKTPSTIMAESSMTIPADSLEYKMGEITDKNTVMKICNAIIRQFEIFSKACLAVS